MAETQDWDMNPKKAGMFHGRTLDSIESEYNHLKSSGPHKEGSPEFTKMKQLHFAMEAKHNFHYHNPGSEHETEHKSVKGAARSAMNELKSRTDNE